MIFILLCVFIVCFFIVWTIMPNTKANKYTGEVLALLIILCTGMMIANLHWHVNMEKETTTTYAPIASLSNKAKVIVHQPIGKVGSQTVVYKVTPDQKKPIVVKPTDSDNVIKQNAKTSEVVTKETNWVYRNKFWAFMYAGAKQKILIHRTNTFYLEPGFQVLTPDQIKAIQNK